MRQHKSSGSLRDFTKPSSFVGDWVVAQKLQTNGSPPFSYTAWNNESGLLEVFPGDIFSFQAVVIEPVVEDNTPTIGAVDIYSIEVEIFDIPQQSCANIDFGGPISPLGTGLGTFAPGSFLPGVASTVGSPTTAAWTATTSSLAGVLSPGSETITYPSFSFGVCGQICNTVATNNVGLCLYVSQVDLLTGVWQERSIFSAVTASREDILDYSLDCFLEPNVFFGYTGRVWTVSLPYPIRIGRGQALTVSLVLDPNSGSAVFIMPFIRSLVVSVA